MGIYGYNAIIKLHTELKKIITSVSNDIFLDFMTQV